MCRKMDMQDENRVVLGIVTVQLAHGRTSKGDDGGGSDSTVIFRRRCPTGRFNSLNRNVVERLTGKNKNMNTAGTQWLQSEIGVSCRP